MAFMCRSARVQRWSAGVAKKPLFQTPTVSENCKGASLHTSAYFLHLHYHKSVFQPPRVETLFHWCLYKSVLPSLMRQSSVYLNLHPLHRQIFFFFPHNKQRCLFIIMLWMKMQSFDRVRLGTHRQPPLPPPCASHHVFWLPPTEHNNRPMLRRTARGNTPPCHQGAVLNLA